MADVEMKDAAPSASGKSKAVARGGKSALGEAKGDSKKRFEVKKVCFYCFALEGQVFSFLAITMANSLVC